MKKSLTILITVFVLLGLCACGSIFGDGFTPIVPQKEVKTPEQVVKALDSNAAVVQTEMNVKQAVLSNSLIFKVEEQFLDSGYTTMDVTPAVGTRLLPKVLRAGNTMVTLQQSGSSVRVMWEVCDPVAFSLLSPNEATGTGTAIMAQIGPGNAGQGVENPGNGMGYVYKLSDGSALIIDGGHNSSADNLFNTLGKMDIDKDEDGRYRITAWVLTHLHGDHYGALITFATNYSTKADISYLMYACTADESLMSTIGVDHTPSFVAYMQGYYPDTVHIAPHAGLQYYFDNLTLQILYAPELMYGSEELNYGNDTSLIFVTECNGVRVLYTGDAGNVAAGVAWDANTTKSFKAHAFQAAHHLMATGPNTTVWNNLKKIYDATGAKIALLTMGASNPVPQLPGNGRWRVLINGARVGEQQSYFLDTTKSETNWVTYMQANYEQFVADVAAGTAEYKTLCGYDGVNTIYNKEKDLTSYLMSSEKEPMATVFALSNSEMALVSNQLLNQWLNDK